MRSYGQHCPVARGAEILAGRFKRLSAAGDVVLQGPRRLVDSLPGRPLFRHDAGEVRAAGA